MTRRAFITLLGGAAVAWPLAARAQQSNAPRPLVACLFGGSKASVRRNFDGFLQGMRELGNVEGQNWVFEARYADGDQARSPRLAEELVRLKPEVIAVSRIHSHEPLLQPQQIVECRWCP
jgi:putative ABC transport system substrate-binding protein